MLMSSNTVGTVRFCVCVCARDVQAGREAGRNSGARQPVSRQVVRRVASTRLRTDGRRRQQNNHVHRFVFVIVAL